MSDAPVHFGDPSPTSPSLLRLAWSPLSLPHVASEYRGIHALRITALLNAFVIATAITGFYGSIGAACDEPYQDAQSYFLRVIQPFPVVFVGCALLWAAPLYLASRFSSPLERPYRRVLLFAPIPFLVPTVICSLALASNLLADSGFQLAAPKPFWVQWPIIALLGSILSIPLLSLAAIALVIWSCLQLRLLRIQRIYCTKCGYPRRGLSSSRCPECGAPLKVA